MIHISSRAARTSGSANVDEREPQPKVSFSTNTQILQDKPDTWFSLCVVEAECTRSQTANQVPCKHPLRLTSHHCHSSKRILILAVATAERSAWRRGGRIGTITAVSREVLLRRAIRTARRVRRCLPIALLRRWWVILPVSHPLCLTISRVTAWRQGLLLIRRRCTWL